MHHRRRAFRLALGLLVLTAGCAGSTYEVTFDYEAGHVYLDVHRAMRRFGGEACLDEAGVTTVMFEIRQVPDPRPSGWTARPLSWSESCDELVGWLVLQ